MTREDVYKAIEQVEHPEIAATLIDLGMILDVTVVENVARLAMALPTPGIPEVVRSALVQSIRSPIEGLGLRMEVEFFEMNDESKNKFLSMAQSGWKGSI